ncbi:MAG: ATP-binding protein [Ignavibacteriales bacterium]|nr:ATP-binding protein [Ignavibacteriales bacterium]
MFKRIQFDKIYNRLTEKRKFIQVLSGPRQSGKTTLANQIAGKLELPIHSVSADSPVPYNAVWLEQQWEIARINVNKNPNSESLLILDEIQKVHGWPEVIKKLWDEDTKNKTKVKVLLLGSAPLLIQKGLTESLAGRFELIPISHWNYVEMRDAFGWNLDQYIWFGGYPGAAELINDEERFKNYIRDSLIETTISRDILLLTRIDKQALLRQLFQLGTFYSGQIVSYQKMLGQLHDAGNTTTLAHYLNLLSASGLLTGLQKYSGLQIRQRSSSPKFLVLNNALISAQSNLSFEEARSNKDYWGRLVETAVGSYLLNGIIGTNLKLMYWREGAKEVDFIFDNGGKITALEVKSGRLRESLAGIETFNSLYEPKRKLLIGQKGIPLEEFFLTPAAQWF